MQYDFAMPPSGGQRIEVAGRFFKYKSGVGSIRVTTSKGAFVDLVPGQGVWGADFSGLSVKDISGFANSGLLLAGDFEFRDEAIPGTVAVNHAANVTVEQFGRQNTLAGKAYMGSVIATVAAGVDSNVLYLSNPAASSKRVIVTKLHYNDQGYNSTAHIVTGYVPASGQTPGQGKLNGVANGTAVFGTEVRSTAQTPSITAITAITPIIFLRGANLAIRKFEFDDPIILQPGTALVIVCLGTNAVANGAFEWREELL